MKTPFGIMQPVDQEIAATIKKILIIQTAFPGDVILTTPLVQATRIQFPAAQIDFLTTPLCANLLETHPDIHEVVVFDKRRQQRGLIKLIQFSRKILNNKNYDLALIPHRSFRSAALAWLAHIPRRIGFNRSAAAFLLTQKIKYRPDIHELERNIDLLGDSINWPHKFSPRIYPDQPDQAIIDNYFKNNRINPSEIQLAIAPGSVWETKKWLKQSYAELCDLFAQEFQCPIFLIGGPADWALCDWIARNSRARTFNTAGAFTFRQSAELISRCQVLICNDSAPLHLGVAVATPVCAIFGPTVPAFGFYPYGEIHTVIEKAVYCRPCSIHGGHKCPTGTFLCMKSILPTDVFAVAKKKLTSIPAE